MSLPFDPHSHVAVLVHFEMDDVRAAANGAIFDVLLFGAGGKVDRHDDLFAARVAQVGRLIVHGFCDVTPLLLQQRFLFPNEPHVMRDVLGDSPQQLL